MFVGHLAVALGSKAFDPRAPLALLVAAAFGLDLLWPMLLLSGVESVRVDPGNTAFTPLAFDHYPWSHSLLMSIGWGFAAGVLAARYLKSSRLGTLVGVAVISHWLLDFLVHRPDMLLWPGGPAVGVGLWNSIPATIAVEGAIFIAAIAVYLRSAGSSRGWAFWSLIGVTGLIWLSGPWSPPPPNATAIALVALAMWLFPAWAKWIDSTSRSQP